MTSTRILAYGVVAVALLSLVLEATVGSFPYPLFRAPLNILCLALWLVLVVIAYRKGADSGFAKVMLSRGATWLSLLVMAGVGIALGVERIPSSSAWFVVVGLLFVLTHLTFVILRGWRNNGGVRWRFVLTHVGLWLALGAGLWGAPDREALRLAVDNVATNEAYTLEGAIRRLPYEVALRELVVERNESGLATNYEAVVDVAGEVVELRVNHPYNLSFGEKLYLVSVSERGDYAVLEAVSEPWQWFSALGIVMLIAGALLLFLRGPRRTNNGV